MAKNSDTLDRMKGVGALLACPHLWGEHRNVTVREGRSKRKCVIRTCVTCGTHRLIYEDGSSALIPANGISEAASK